MPKPKPRFTHLPKMTRIIDGERYDYVGSGPKKNIESRAKQWRAGGFKVRTFKGAGKSRRIYISRRRRK